MSHQAKKPACQAAGLAAADHFILQMPEGYQTNMSERAGNPSQGQRQLLAIARVIHADQGILILNEATSSVDVRTEIRIQTALFGLMKKRTSFVIAQRLRRIRDADQLLVVDNGEIIERGAHQELLNLQGVAYQLDMSQFKEGEAREKWDETHPKVRQSWRNNWQRIIPYFAYPLSIRRVISATNAIEALNMSLGKVTKDRGSFPNDETVFKLLHLALNNISKKWTMPIKEWKTALNQFSTMFDGEHRVFKRKTIYTKFLRGPFLVEIATQQSCVLQVLQCVSACGGHAKQPTPDL